ncbi:hypothetical protein [Planococcus salinus]|uniref:Uncharacterized protein n=1 Tax=Planococcus salinus TaxID=1848460 RepID=A0A3M8P7A9_9BACL|nr:hypothetical protein [Planococcus salinus]RNF39556.1 hypothetical protein EEX84_08765 [Planococcus salinus]
MSMQQIVANDLVHDEYGNYYQVVGTQTDEEKLTALEVSNLYFEISFQTASEELDDTYKGQPVGNYLQEQLNNYIEAMERNNRPIYAIRDLMVNQITVYAVDITKPHPKSNQTS